MAQEAETPPVTPDSISDALSQTQPRFEGAILQGHPAEEPLEEEPLETPPAQRSSPSLASESPRYKYETLDAYEQAYTDAERRLHTATEEARLARDEAARLTARVTALEITPEASPPPAKSPPGPSIAQVAREIAELDQDAPEYYDRLASKWQGMIETLIEQQGREIARTEAERVAKQAVATAQTTWQATQQRQTEEARVLALAVEEAKTVGLDIEHNVRDQRLFWQVIAPEVDEALPSASYEERIREAVKRVPEFRTPPTNGGLPPIPPAETVASRRAALRPMGRQSAGPGGPGAAVEPPAEEPQPMSITAALQQGRARQRV